MQNQFGVRLTCGFTLALSLILSAKSHAISRDRILQPVDSSQSATVHGTAHPMARPRYDRGRRSTSRMISRASLTLRLSSEQQAELNNLIREQQDPASPNYHKWLSPAQYAQRFGVSDNDLGKITTWLQSQGLRVDGISENRTEIFFSGTVAQIQQALQTEIHNLSVNGEQHFANTTDIQVPAAFADLVLGVRKLNDFAPKPHLRQATSPHFTSSLSGNHFIAPGDFATLYDLSPLYSQGLDGGGQTIAVIGQTDINISDAHAFRAASGLSVNDPTKMLVPNTGVATVCSGGDVNEANLDVEWSGGVAKSASVIYVFAGVGASPATCSTRTANVFDALQYAITNKVAPVISISYGDCEARFGSSNSKILQQWAQQAVAQGQTITAASGDSGAADCDFNDTSATQGLAVDVPASIPEVTGIGGTEFTGDSAATVTSGCASATTYWGQSCSPTSGASALSYIPETAWNDPPTSSAASLSASGGGASTLFAKPSWQTGPGVPNDNARDVPDVSLSSSPGHDGYLICANGNCVTGFRDASNNLAAVGGTSVGAPAFAGILAIVNQATQSSGVGNANSQLYNLAVSTPSAFHDINSGDNKVPCTAGSTDCPNGGTIGFSAAANYDQATGLGSIDAFNLVTAWPGFVAVPGFSISANPLTFTVAVGGSGSSNVTVAASNGFTGSVSLTCAVPANTRNISCAMSPSSVVLNSTTTSGTATLTINGVAVSQTRSSDGQIFAAGLMAPGLWLLGLPMVKSAGKKWTGMLLLSLLAVLVSCGGGSSPTNPSNSHQVQTYAVTVTGTSGGSSHTVTVNVTE